MSISLCRNTLSTGHRHIRPNLCYNAESRAHTLPVSSVSSTSIVSEEEEHQRIFYTRRDPRRVRTLKRLCLLPRTPSSITYAEIGVQVVLQPEPDPQEFVEALRGLLKEFMGMTTKNFDEVKTSHANMKDLEVVLDQFTSRLEMYERDLEQIEQKNTQLVEQFAEKELEGVQLRSDLKTAVQELSECRSKLNQAVEDSATLEKEKTHLLSTVDDLQLETERLELDVAFLTEEKVDLETSLGEHKSILDLVSQEKEEAQSKEDELKSALLQTKISSAEQVGKYLDELNAVWAEKRNFIKHKLTGKSVPNELKSILSSTDRMIEVEEERNRLVDQVELLSTQAVFQDLLIEQFQKHLLHLIRINSSTENGSVRDLLLNEELEKAKKLIDSESPIFKVMSKRRPEKRKDKSLRRTSASLPSSPLVANKYWSTGDLVTRRSSVEGTKSAENSAGAILTKKTSKSSKSLIGTVQSEETPKEDANGQIKRKKKIQTDDKARCQSVPPAYPQKIKRPKSSKKVILQ